LIAGYAARYGDEISWPRLWKEVSWWHVIVRKKTTFTTIHAVPYYFAFRLHPLILLQGSSCNLIDVLDFNLDLLNMRLGILKVQSVGGVNKSLRTSPEVSGISNAEARAIVTRAFKERSRRSRHSWEIGIAAPMVENYPALANLKLQPLGEHFDLRVAPELYVVPGEDLHSE
jgi:hypothetical protein